ncbi:gag-pol polyprotein, partial [Tanacetum coccineum]
MAKFTYFKAKGRLIDSIFNDMIWHATGKCTDPGKMQHPVDGGAWKKFDTKYPDFAKEPRNVRLGLAAD